MASIRFAGGTYTLDSVSHKLTIRVNLKAQSQVHPDHGEILVASLGDQNAPVTLLTPQGVPTSWRAGLMVYRDWLAPEYGEEKTIEQLRDLLRRKLTNEERRIVIATIEALTHNEEPLDLILSQRDVLEPVLRTRGPINKHFGERRED